MDDLDSKVSYKAPSAAVREGGYNIVPQFSSPSKRYL